MTTSGYDCWKRKGLSRRRKLESVGAETTSSGSPFQIRGQETLKARLPTVDSRNRGTIRRPELAERSARRPCWSVTRSSGPRYRGAVPCRTLYVSTAILYWIRSGTRSQCRLSRASVMWSEHLRWKISRAPAFITDCRRHRRHVGKPTSTLVKCCGGGWLWLKGDPNLKLQVSNSSKAAENTLSPTLHLCGGPSFLGRISTTI